MKLTPAASKALSAAQRAVWPSIKGLKGIYREALSYDGLEPVMWELIECRTAKASEELCRLFGANGWCVKEAKEAQRYLPLYLFLRDQQGHLSLMGCYSDHDQILSDRANKDMFETDKKLYKMLSRMMLTARPKSLILSSVLIGGLRDLAESVPSKAPPKKLKAIVDVIGKTIKSMTKDFR